MANNKPSAIVPHEESKIIPMTEANRLIKRTIFDMDDVSYLRVEKMAEAYALSTFNPKKDNKPQRTKHDYLLIMLKGMELGFSPMAAVDMISVIQGKPTLDGKGMLAIAYASNVLEDIRISGDEKSCTVIVKRRGIATRFEFIFTINDAKAMGLLSKEGNNYQKQPKVMLKWRAVANCLREALPDFLGGLYTPEELAPQQTIVWEDGGMEYTAPALPVQKSAPQLQAPQAPAKADINDADAWDEPDSLADSPEDYNQTGEQSDINDVDKYLGTRPSNLNPEQRFMLDLIEIIDPICNHENHARNAIKAAIADGAVTEGMSLDKAAAAVFLRRCASQWGLTEIEVPVYVEKALGRGLRAYFADNPRDYRGVWQALHAHFAEFPL